MKAFRSICILLIFVLILAFIPAGAFAETRLAQDDTQQDFSIIEAFAKFPADTANQTLTIGSGQKPRLPSSISVRLQGEDTFSSLEVSWDLDMDDAAEKVGSFLYTPRLPSQYQLAEGVSLPSISVNVVKADTSVAGLSKTLKKKARTSLSDKITVTPAYGRSVKLQMKKNGEWVTKKTFKLENTEKSSLTVKYPKDWWKVTASSWRIVLPESDEAKSWISSAVTVKTQRYYQNPSGYIQIKDKITLRHSGSYNLNTGYMGLKVRKVNNYFKIGSKYWPRYTSQTKARVKAFQRKKKLKATGIVNKTTWLKMGFSESSWSTLGAYVSPIKVNPSSTKKQHIEAMISTAKKYLGADYVVGASGSPSQGADCSGLVMQALYAAGVDPYPVSCVRHSKPGYEYESRNLWKNKKFKSVPYTQKKRGDLIFYKGRGGAIIHIAIYLGKGKVIESWPNKVVIWPIKNSHRSRIAGVKRVFI